MSYLDIFQLRDRLIHDYAACTSSCIQIRDQRIGGYVDESLKGKAENTKGNLDVPQTGNYIGVYTLEEQRRLRHMIGALTNAYHVAVAHQINIEASAERAMRDWVEKSQPPSA